MSEPKYVCDNCNKKFYNKKQLINHKAEGKMCWLKTKLAESQSEIKRLTELTKCIPELEMTINNLRVENKTITKMYEKCLDFAQEYKYKLMTKQNSDIVVSPFEFLTSESWELLNQKKKNQLGKIIIEYDVSKGFLKYIEAYYITSPINIICTDIHRKKCYIYKEDEQWTLIPSEHLLSHFKLSYIELLTEQSEFIYKYMSECEDKDLVQSRTAHIEELKQTKEIINIDDTSLAADHDILRLIKINQPTNVREYIKKTTIEKYYNRVE